MCGIPFSYHVVGYCLGWGSGCYEHCRIPVTKVFGLFLAMELFQTAIFLGEFWPLLCHVYLLVI